MEFLVKDAAWMQIGIIKIMLYELLHKVVYFIP